MKQSGGHIEEDQKDKKSIDVMVCKHKTIFYNERGILELSSAISAFCLENKVEIKRKTKKTCTDLSSWNVF